MFYILVILILTITIVFTKIMIASIRGKILSISKGSLIAKMKSSPTFGMNMSFQLLVITQIASFVGS